MLIHAKVHQSHVVSICDVLCCEQQLTSVAPAFAKLKVFLCLLRRQTLEDSNPLQEPLLLVGLHVSSRHSFESRCFRCNFVRTFCYHLVNVLRFLLVATFLCVWITLLGKFLLDKFVETIEITSARIFFTIL